MNDNARPVPFYDLTLFVVLSLFTGGSQAENILTALGESAVKRERTTKNVKS